MASGRGSFEAPNHTQTPNTLFDVYLPLMSGAELKVTLAICRKTFGWHQKEDRLSLSQLQKLTGLSRQSVINGIDQGVDRGTIARRQVADSWSYSLVLDGQLSLAGGSPKSRPASQKSGPASGQDSGPRGGQESGHTKETGNKLVKDTPRKKGGMSARDRRTLDRLGTTTTTEEAA